MMILITLFWNEKIKRKTMKVFRVSTYIIIKEINYLLSNNIAESTLWEGMSLNEKQALKL